VVSYTIHGASMDTANLDKVPFKTMSIWESNMNIAIKSSSLEHDRKSIEDINKAVGQIRLACSTPEDYRRNEILAQAVNYLAEAVYELSQKGDNYGQARQW